MALGAIFPILGASVVAQGIQASQAAGTATGKIRPGAILGAALQIQALSEAGLVPRASTDPFTGNLVVSTVDQAPNLLGILADRADRLEFPFTEEDEGALFAARERFIDRAAATARPTIALTKVSPPAFSNRVTARPASGGGVQRGGIPSVSAVNGLNMLRLSSLCAGAQTQISRLRCGGV